MFDLMIWWQRDVFGPWMQVRTLPELWLNAWADAALEVGAR